MRKKGEFLADLSAETGVAIRLGAIRKALAAGGSILIQDTAQARASRIRGARSSRSDFTAGTR